jgi:hypothetical protein
VRYNVEDEEREEEDDYVQRASAVSNVVCYVPTATLVVKVCLWYLRLVQQMNVPRRFETCGCHFIFESELYPLGVGS